MAEIILAAQLFSTVFMTGLIWFVQIVHYPLYARIGAVEFPEYQQRHQKLTTLVVGPVMLMEAASAVAWLYWLPSLSGLPMWVSVGLLLLIWISTAGLQVPAHGRLAAGYSDDVRKHLVNTNWIRTAAWSIRSGIVIWLVLELLTIP